MKRKLLALTTVTLLFSTVTAYTVWNPSPDIQRNFENENFEIIVKDLEAGSGTMEAKVNQVGKRTIYLEPQPLDKMVETCKTLYGSSITENPSPCNQYRNAVLNQ